MGKSVSGERLTKTTTNTELSDFVEIRRSISELNVLHLENDEMLVSKFVNKKI